MKKTWNKEEAIKRLESLKSELRIATNRRKTASENWLNAYRTKGVDSDMLYNILQDAEKEERRIEKDAYILECLTADKCFANQKFYTDIEPWEVVEIYNENCIAVREMDYERIDNNGMSDCQDYRFESNEENPICIIRRHKNGAFYLPNNKGSHFRLGKEPERYYDFSF